VAELLAQYREVVEIDGENYGVTVQFSDDHTGVSAQVPHNHSRFELHVYADGGAVLEFGKDRRLQLYGGMGCLIAPHVYHTRVVTPQTQRFYSVLVECPKNSPLRAVTSEYLLLQDSQELLRLLLRLERELMGQLPGAASCARSLCTLLLAQLLREVAALPGQRIHTGRSSGKSREDLIDNYFALHYAWDISASDLAQRLGITPRQLSRSMQRLYGCSFRQRLLQTRLHHAKRYLSTTSMPIWEVASCCGFTDQGAFTTAFGKHEGCTPTEYRKQTSK